MIHGYFFYVDSLLSEIHEYSLLLFLHLSLQLGSVLSAILCLLRLNERQISRAGMESDTCCFPELNC